MVIEVVSFPVRPGVSEATFRDAVGFNAASETQELNRCLERSSSLMRPVRSVYRFPDDAAARP